MKMSALCWVCTLLNFRYSKKKIENHTLESCSSVHSLVVPEVVDFSFVFSLVDLH